MEAPQNPLTCHPSIEKFPRMVVPENVVPNLLRFLRGAGLPNAENIDVFSDFSDPSFKNWFGLDFPLNEMCNFADDPCKFRGYVSQIRNYVRMKAAILSNSLISSASEQIYKGSTLLGARSIRYVCHCRHEAFKHKLREWRLQLKWKYPLRPCVGPQHSPRI